MEKFFQNHQFCSFWPDMTTYDQWNIIRLLHVMTSYIHLITSYDPLWPKMTIFLHVPEKLFQWDQSFQFCCFDQIWPLMTSYDQLWSVMASYDQFWQYITSYDQLWQAYYLLWPAMTSYDQFLPVMTESNFSNGIRASNSVVVKHSHFQVYLNKKTIHLEPKWILLQGKIVVNLSC